MKNEKCECSSILAVLGLFACGTLSFGQTIEQPVVLTIETENVVFYRGDVTDATKLASDPGVTTPGPAKAFQYTHNIGDIVTVNGKPAKGLMHYRGAVIVPRIAPQPGQAIADYDGAGPYLSFWYILQADGNWVGTLATGGAFPPGQSVGIITGNGAFLGVSGEQRAFEMIRMGRNASVSEDPANRRSLPGAGRMRTVFYLYPKYRPAVVDTIDGPAIFHGDLTPVTAKSPAKAGETLIVQARNLGPTRPDMLPQGSHVFKADPPEVVNSPVEVTVNGTSATVMKQIGWPGTSELYRVEFQMPEVSSGSATIQITAAWIPGPEVQIPVQ